jgi:hypothetical protein
MTGAPALDGRQTFGVRVPDPLRLAEGLNDESGSIGANPVRAGKKQAPILRRRASAWVPRNHQNNFGDANPGC